MISAHFDGLTHPQLATPPHQHRLNRTSHPPRIPRRVPVPHLLARLLEGPPGKLLRLLAPHRLHRGGVGGDGNQGEEDGEEWAVEEVGDGDEDDEG